MNGNKEFFKHVCAMNFAHRGFSGKFPEHTLLSYREAIKAGADVLELDVRLSKDNHVMVIHDKTLGRTTNGKGLVRNKTIAELKKLNAGNHFINVKKKKNSFKNQDCKIPCLTELFIAFPNTKFNIDIKDHDKKICEIVMENIKEHKMSNKVIVTSENHDTIKFFRNISKRKTATGASPFEIRNFIFMNISHRLKRCLFDADAIQIPMKYHRFQLLTEKLIQKAHKKNIALHAWTINQKKDMMRLLSWNIDGIITDFPDLLNNAIQELKQQ